MISTPHSSFRASVHARNSMSLIDVPDFKDVTRRPDLDFLFFMVLRLFCTRPNSTPSRATHLAPLGADVPRTDRVLERPVTLSQLHQRGASVRVEDGISRVHLQRLGIQQHGRVEVSFAARLVRRLHFVQEHLLLVRRHPVQVRGSTSSSSSIASTPATVRL